MKSLIGLILVCSCPLLSCGQSKLVDSLKNELNKAKEDTNKINLLNSLSQCDGWRVQNFEATYKYTSQAIELANKLNFKKGLIASYNSLGIVASMQGDNLKAITIFEKSLKIAQKYASEVEVAAALGNMGNVYRRLGNLEMALSFQLKSLRIKEKKGNPKELANSYNNIGNIYDELHNLKKALEYHRLSLKLKRTNGDDDIAASYNNIGNAYLAMNQYDIAMKNYDTAVLFSLKKSDKKGLATAYNNLAFVFRITGDNQQSLKYNKLALALKLKYNMIYDLPVSYNNIGSNYLYAKQTKQAKLWYGKSLKLSKEIGAIQFERDAYKGLYEVYHTLGNDRKALENFQNFILYRDSILSEANTKKVTEMQMQYEFDKKQSADSIANMKEQQVQEAKIDKQKAEISAQRNLQYALYGGLMLVLAFAGLMYNRFRISNKQKEIISTQKFLVEKKSKEIHDSITYAKRIQEAILPSRFSLTEHLSNGFVLFQPKDIVSGDFYWLEKVGKTTYFAAADCTGHGVPGAMVSVVCANALSKALLEENISDTGKLLDRTRELVIERFENSDEDVKDGMDISLCKLEGNSLQWSGANNPLWIIRKGANEVEEIKADKQPIGKTQDPKSFTAHHIDLQEGDTLYIFTDGYADQFGGERGKKFMYKPMKELLIGLQDKSMVEQKENLRQSFDNWKGDLEQIDDVCIIGVRIWRS